jgi:hypothetical protein
MVARASAIAVVARARAPPRLETCLARLALNAGGVARTTNDERVVVRSKPISIFERATARGIARRTVSDRDREGRAFRELRSIAKIAVGPRFRPAGQRLEAPFKEKKERPATWISV